MSGATGYSPVPVQRAERPTPTPGPGCSPHSWEYRGVVYSVSDRPLAGGSAHEIRYFDAYFCTLCREMQFDALPGPHDSYSTIRHGATPRPEGR